MWKEFFNFNFIVTISGLLYLILLVTSEPVCYTPEFLDERNRYMKRVDCDGGEKICHRFASSEDVTLGVLLDSPCTYPEEYTFTHENAYKATTCSTTNLPYTTDGSFDCAPNTDVSMGEACALSCKDGFYAAYSDQVVCEAGITNQEGKWSEGSFLCLAISCQDVHLPTTSAGYFKCSGYSVGDKCNLTCDDKYYPSATKFTVCEEYDDHKANWTVGKFQCSAITCSTTNLPTVTEGSFDCASNFDVPKDEACTLTCNDGFYPAYSNRTIVCEAGTSNQEGMWSYGSFVCRSIKCSTTNLPTVSEGSFDCATNSNVSMGEACNLTCNDGFYPAYSRQAVCGAGISNQGGVWSNGTFVCRRLKCNEWNEWHGDEYKFSSTRLPWQECRQLCQNDNSDLVSIEDKRENEFVYKMLRHCNGGLHAAIGLNDLNTEGTLKWIDGTVSTYRNWGEQPNGGAFNCVIMGRDNGKWYNWPCIYDRHTVCERNNSRTYK